MKVLPCIGWQLVQHPLWMGPTTYMSCPEFQRTAWVSPSILSLCGERVVIEEHAGNNQGFWLAPETVGMTSSIFFLVTWVGQHQRLDSILWFLLYRTLGPVHVHPKSTCLYPCLLQHERSATSLLLEFHIPKWRVWTRKHQHAFHL